MSVQDISLLIRVKERELHDIHEGALNQLEKAVEERDHLLLTAQR